MILTTTSVAPYNLTSLRVRTRSRSQASGLNQSCHLATLKHKHKCHFAAKQQMQSFSVSLELRYPSSKRCMSVHSSVDPGPPLPSDPYPGSWKFWIVGMLISVVLPFWKNKWWPLSQLKDRVESVVETAEHVTEIIEKVADEVEKVAEDVADHLPENGKLKETVTFIENVAKETAKDAHLAEEVIEKVEEVEKEADSLIERVTDEANDIHKEAKDLGNTNVG